MQVGIKVNSRKVLGSVLDSFDVPKVGERGAAHVSPADLAIRARKLSSPPPAPAQAHTLTLREEMGTTPFERLQQHPTQCTRETVALRQRTSSAQSAI